MRVQGEEKHLLQENYNASLSAIDYGTEDCLYVGNLDAKRDWGHAEDYVKYNGKCCKKILPKITPPEDKKC